MQAIVEGNIGSGKTFFVVQYMLKYCKYDELYREYQIQSDALIISNIEELKIKHLDLAQLLTKYTVEEFFTVENFEKIQKQYKVKNIILAIDEAQKIFDSKFFNKDVFFFFQYQRHLGIDTLLITQSRSTLARHLLPICEYLVQAKPRSKGVEGTFTYNFTDTTGKYMYNKTVRARKEVFRAYKSMNTDEINKPRNVLKMYAIGFTLTLCCCFALFKSVFAWFKVSNKPDIVAAQKQQKAVMDPIPGVQFNAPPAVVANAAVIPPRFKPLSSVVSAPVKRWIAIDLVYRDGVSPIRISLKGYRGVFKVTNPIIKDYDLANMVAVADMDKLIPL